MSNRTYTVESGVFIFPVSDSIALHLRNVNKDRYGRLYGDARFVTADGGLLAQDIGNLTSGPWRQSLCAQAGTRNAGHNLDYENAVMEAVVALEKDPSVGLKDGAIAKPHLVPVAEYLRNIPPPRPFLVQDLFEMGTLQGVVAKPKVAKSLLTLGLAVTVATNGGSWLGRKVEPGRVAVSQLEDSPRTVGRRLQTMMAGILAPNLFLHQSTEPFKLTEENYADVIEQCQGCSLIVLDPIAQATNISDWNSPAEVRAAWDLWRRVARDLDCVVMVVAHHRKALGDFGDQVSGSIQAVATPDGLLEIRRDAALPNNQRRISYLGRDWPDIPDEVIELDGLTLTFKVVGEAAKLAEERRKETQEANALSLSMKLPKGSPGLRAEDIEQKTGIPIATVGVYLRYLEAHYPNNLQITGKKRSKKNPSRYWWRSDDSPAYK